jgi:osmoprotectant transport system permease protein
LRNKLKQAENHRLNKQSLIFKNLKPAQDWIIIDKLAAVGSIIGILSLVFGWFTLKLNRLASGISLNLPSSIGWVLTLLLSALWLACLFLAFRPKKNWQPFMLGSIANIILILCLIFLGSVAARLVQENTERVRISPGAGIWITFLAVYLIVFSSRKSLKKKTAIQNILTWAGPTAFIILLLSGHFNNLSIIVEYSVQKLRFMQEFLQHIFLVAICVFFGSVFGLILGIWATRNKRAETVIFFLTNISQTIPSLALFGLLIAPLSLLSFKFAFLREAGIRGIGNTPAIIALIIYSLLPIVRNTYTSIRQLDRSIIDAGRGMGMNRFGIFMKIEIPLSAPIILEGVRIAAVQSIGLTAVAALIGAGGLGWFIFQGLGQAAADMVLLGAIPIILLALVTDGFMRIIIRLATPKGLTKIEGN